MIVQYKGKQWSILMYHDKYNNFKNLYRDRKTQNARMVQISSVSVIPGSTLLTGGHALQWPIHMGKLETHVLKEERRMWNLTLRSDSI